MDLKLKTSKKSQKYLKDFFNSKSQPRKPPTIILANCNFTNKNITNASHDIQTKLPNKLILVQKIKLQTQCIKPTNLVVT
jgi:hypothetical protein